MKKILLFLLLSLSSFSFDIDIESLEDLGIETVEENKQEELNLKAGKFDFTGKFSMDLKGTKYQTDRAIFKMKDLKDYSYENKLSLNLDGNYKLDKFDFNFRTYSEYYSSNESSFSLYEAYVKYMPNYNFSTELGKKSLNWGKGYAFNPVGIFNPVKDVSNPENLGEGNLVLNLEYTKAFEDKKIDIFTGNLVILLNNKDENSGEIKDVDFALKEYIFAFNTDIDFLIARKDRNLNLGFDFSRNILKELEFHVEYLYEKKVEVLNLKENLLENYSEKDINSYLVGLKYILPTTTDLTLEYFHNGSGYEKEDYKIFYNYYLENQDKAFSKYKEYFSEKNFMRDYLYLKLSQKEPFNILYTNISYVNVLNLEDKSNSNKLSFSYEPFTDIELGFDLVYLAGKEGTEYGDKANLNSSIKFDMYF